MALAEPSSATLPTPSVKDLLTDVMVLVIELKAELAVAQTQLGKVEDTLVALKKAFGLSDDPTPYQFSGTRPRDELEGPEEREHKRLKQVYLTKRRAGTPTASLGGFADSGPGMNETPSVFEATFVQRD